MTASNSQGPEATIPLPEGTTLRPSPDLRSLAGGTVLVGGAPLSILRLSAPGAAAVRRWFRGEMVGSDSAHQALARRLMQKGLASPGRIEGSTADDSPSLGDLTVVIPVKDDASGLARTLASLEPTHPTETGGSVLERPRIIVVDDGSALPLSAEELPAGAALLRNPQPVGPGQAREQGLQRVTTPLVAFIDAGLDFHLSDLIVLVRPFDDPNLVALAPRVRSTQTPHLVGRYDEHRSPLDLGANESLVGPGRAISYVPSALLLARSSAVAEVGGFDPGLRYGEDVDLVWRLSNVGDVRYLPTVEVYHPPRSTIGAMARQRAAYGSAAAPLTTRHGDVVAPARISPWTVITVGFAVTGHPFMALVAGGSTAWRLRPKLQALPEPTIEAVILAWRGHWHGSLSVLHATARAWSPLLLPALATRRARRRIAGLVALALARRLLDGPRTPRAAALDMALGTVDDVSYACGVWRGVFRERSAKSLMPAVMSWPNDTK